MESFFYSNNFNLIVVLIAIIAIVSLFLRFGKEQNHSKIHLYYISGLCAFIVIELSAYICLNNEYADNIVSYISFASTISSLFLSVIAIIYAIVSNNKGEAQYFKIDKASEKITTSVNQFSTISENLSKEMENIKSRLDEIKNISSDTRNQLANNIFNRHDTSSSVLTNDTAKVSDIIKYFSACSSYSGLLSIIACIYSCEKEKPFSLIELFGENAEYCYGYMVATCAFGFISIDRDCNSVITVTKVNAGLRKDILMAIKRFIKNYKDQADAESKWDELKTFFEIEEDSTEQS